MCIDDIDLNKACPKDSFSLLRIDQLVNATLGHQLLTFMDAFFRYNQIKMAPHDEEKMAFIINRGLYCYNVMPFRLKVVGATYQRLVNNIFKDQIDCNIEVYVDDMLVKRCHLDQRLFGLEETFTTLKRIHMKLNLVKDSFRVSIKKFLGFIVTQQGIEANPKKI